jgi:hypothetical protein
MKVNITGFTSNHRSGFNRKNVINFSNLIEEILNDNKHEAGHNIEKPNINIVFVNSLGSLNSRYAAEAMQTIRDEDCIVAFDDWQIKEFYKSMENLINKPKSYTTHPWHGDKNIHQYEDVARNILEGKYKVLFPAYKTGNHELLGIIGEKYCLDPSIYIKKDIPKFTPRELIPVHASLAAKTWVKKIQWPIIDLNKVTEDEVFKNYLEHRVVLSPPHPHDGSGWFRNRYSLANIAKAVIVEDRKSVFGTFYKNLLIEDVNEDNIDFLFKCQDKAYKETIMTKEEINKVLKEVL